MPLEKLRPAFTFTEDRLRELQASVPEAFADGKINWDSLREAVGEHLEDETKEHFGLFWPGKREARRLAGMPSKGTMVPQPGQGVNEEITNNIFIEGDNLEVLKLLQKSYAGRVKLIYIDPPYNTGNDFVYPDDYSEPLDAYLKQTAQIDEAGRLLTTNTRAGGRFHSNWLNMLYPRLLLARSLLKDDGVLWISIDDGEAANLQLACNEILGEGNFVTNFVWEKRTTRENRRVFSVNHDYVLCYAKDKDLFEASRHMLPLSEEALGRYSNPDNDPRGDWQSVSLNAQAGHATPSQFYELQTPGGKKLNPPPGRCWSVTRVRLQELIADNRIWFGSDGNNVPRLKVFLSEANQGLTPHTLWKAEEVGTTDSAKKALNELFGGDAVFDTPKPVELLKRIIHISSSENDLVLDFFAGSCTTAQATMELNQDDGGRRQFIMVQLPEPTRNVRYPTIADIGRTRIGLAIERMKSGRAGELESSKTLDLGFRCYRLDHSNYAEWQPFTGTDTTQLELRFGLAQTPLVEGWKSEDLLVEILLMQGFPLDSTARSLPEFKANTVHQVTCDEIAHHLFICLDERIEPVTVAALKLRREDILVALDTALSDEAKVTLADQTNLRVI